MRTPEEIEALANRIDHEELWRLSPLDTDKLTPEQQDRLWAGIFLRRHAEARNEVRERLKEGAQFIRGYQLGRSNNGGTDRFGTGDGPWHGAINAFADAQRKAGKSWPKVMYQAKTIADEVPRMVLLFQYERQHGMPDSYKMCAHDPRPATPLKDNHLRCGLGQQCRSCALLQAIDRDERMTPEAKDEAKAWTCATHFLLESEPDVHFEQILRDKGDDAFDARLAASFAAERNG